VSNQALCIGINYVGTDSELYGCLNDAQDWAQELESRGFHVTRLLEAEATRVNILAAITERVAATGQEGTCVITYSGHGSYRADDDGDEADGRDEIWCPIDFGNGIYVADDDLYSVMRDHGQGTDLVVISDSCFSGTMTRAALSPLSTSRHPRVRFLPPSKVLAPDEALRAAFARRAPRSVRPDLATLMAACTDTEYSYDGEFDGRANGAFTYCALQALRVVGAGATYRQWMDVIRRYLPSSSYPQTPGLQGTPEQRDRQIFTRAARRALRARVGENRRPISSPTRDNQDPV
jgi:metacaspase-1